ncbi:MAG: hypothetical protein EPN60_07350 [Nevskiaceae bacterium]|jgi:putative oxidoreductase|nr:MAG: hypothetical protein EPO48_02440 [Nevskiaceae bacterium]TAM28330.1 MAG: hypothetical protein EPN60_07350 [Nevskiaceae bacterium]
MPAHGIYVVARALLASVFIGLGAARLLAGLGLIDGGGAVYSFGTLGFSAFELAAGLAIAIGWRVRWLALLMAAFLAIDAVLSHPFWSHQGAELHAQLLHFLKNLAAIGGLLLLSWVEGGGRLSRGSL